MIVHTPYTIAAPTPASAEDWRTRATCRQVDPETMFPDNDKAGIEEARDVCRPCPVRQECLRSVLHWEGNRGKDMRWGIFAGLTPQQRQRAYANYGKGRQ
ncbi:WhiB family transcriptional regulator [Streptomyces sp. NPDC056105]|uniref:WhiB family transcriptional regulator n=1 Tax=Streptomyces sp. NPDC056105 TaxID=3345714 RepID=UPI0035D60881